MSFLSMIETDMFNFIDAINTKASEVTESVMREIENFDSDSVYSMFDQNSTAPGGSTSPDGPAGSQNPQSPPPPFASSYSFAASSATPPPSYVGGFPKRTMSEPCHHGNHHNNPSPEMSDQDQFSDEMDNQFQPGYARNTARTSRKRRYADE